MQSAIFEKIMASDRLTQLQDAVNTQAENFCNSIGILQQFASGSSFPEFSDIRGNGNNGSSTPPVYGPTSMVLNGLRSSADSTPNTASTPTSVTSALNVENNGLNSENNMEVFTNGLQPSTSSTIGISISPNKAESGLHQSVLFDELVKDIKKEPIDSINPTSTNNGTTAAIASTASEDYGLMFARIIAHTAKDIDILIDSLPSTNETDQPSSSSINSSSSNSSATDLYSSSIRKLEQENCETAAQLEETIKRGEAMLERIQSALAEIAQCQLKSQSLDC